MHMSKTTSQAISLSVQDAQPSIEFNLGIPLRNGVLRISSPNNKRRAEGRNCFLFSAS